MQPIQEPLPSLKRILFSTALAAVIAAILLVTVVLPTEYQLDPLGTGRLLGLDALSSSAAKYTVSGEGFNTGQYSIKLQSGEEQEHKMLMEKDSTVVFTWEVRGARNNAVTFDFHGEPTQGNFPKGYFKSYAEGEARMSKGTFVAPFTGRHGWYWQNVSGEPVTIVVKLAGRYARFDRVDAVAKKPAAPKT